jgi:hypothetical protein
VSNKIALAINIDILHCLIACVNTALMPHYTQ